MTLDEFLAQRYPPNAYLDEPGWEDLYVRKAPIAVHINGKAYKVHKVFTFANIGAEQTGTGLFTRLVEKLVSMGWAIYVECVHSPRLRDGLRRRGYLELKTEGAPHFLYNYEGHLHEWTLEGRAKN